MAMQRRCFVFLLGGAAVAALPGTSGCSASRIGEAVALSQRSEPLQQAPPDAVQRLLIVGDSTGVGTGASSAQGSLAGLIARDHPRLHIDNRSRDGATFADVVQQLEGEERHDVILVLAGGNDITRMRALDAVRTDIDRVASMASARATYVVLMPAGNVGNARFFVPPVSWLMTSRSRTLHDLCSRRGHALSACLREPVYGARSGSLREGSAPERSGWFAPQRRGLPGVVPRVAGADGSRRPAVDIARRR